MSSLQPATTYFINRISRHHIWQPATYRCLPRRILPTTCRQYLPKYDLTNCVRSYTATQQQILDDMRTEISSRYLCKCSAKFSDCSTSCSNNNDILHLTLHKDCKNEF